MSHWTDNIPDDWGMETLDKSVSNVVDNRGKTAPTAEVGIPLIATNCIKEHGLFPVFEKLRYIDDDTYKNWFRGHPEPNDILFVNKGTPGGVCVVPDPVPFCIAQDMVALRADPEKFDWKYLFSALRSSFVRSQIEALNVGTSIPHLKKTDFNRIVIPRPSIEDQKVIGDIYYSLSDKIELNLQMNKTLEEMAMALYKHWFVDFGPFQEVEFVDSELGMIPKGWEVKRLKDLIELNPRLSLHKGTETSFVEMKILPVDVMSVSEIARKEFSGGAKFQNGDTLFARITPCLENGKTAYVDFLKEKEIAFGSTEFLVMRAKKGVSKYWTYCLSRDSNFRKFSVSTMVGTSGRQRVQNDPFMSYEIVKPPSEIFLSFTNEVEPWYFQIRLNTIENQTLTALRDTLLPKLISGEVRVKEAEQILEEAL